MSVENAVADGVMQRRAMFSWLFPLLAWASQILAAVTIRGVPGLAPVWLFLMLLQLFLIVGGLVFGCRVLAAKSVEARAARPAAIVGVILSGGTLLLIAVFLVLALAVQIP